MTNFWDILKTFIATCLSSIFAFLTPVQNTMSLLLIVALADILVGIVADLRVHDIGFRFRKFFFALVCAAVYLFIVVMIYTVGWFQQDVQEALLVVKSITYVMTYFYGTNILRNLKLLLPGNRTIAFLYHMLGLEFTRRFPALESFLNHDKEKPEA